jgi:hypothetical protein
VIKVTINTPAGYDVDGCVNWAIDNCPSFDVYRLVELSWDEKNQLVDCWFCLEVEFEDPADATMFSLRFL